MNNRARDILATLQRLGVVIQNSHIVLPSDRRAYGPIGDHTTSHIDIDKLYPYTEETSEICKALAMWFYRFNIEVVVAQNLLGAILSQWIAHHLTALHRTDESSDPKNPSIVLSACAERKIHGSLEFTDICEQLIVGKRALIVIDVFTSDFDVYDLIHLVKSKKANVIGVGAIIKRNSKRRDEILKDQNFHTLVDLPPFEIWNYHTCPLCKQKIPINTEVAEGQRYINWERQVDAEKKKRDRKA